MEKIERIEDVGPCIREVMQKIDRGRYKMGVLQELFAVPPDCSEHQPEDSTLFYMGVKTILDEIMEESTKASDDLLGLFHSEPLRP